MFDRGESTSQPVVFDHVAASRCLVSSPSSSSSSTAQQLVFDHFVVSRCLVSLAAIIHFIWVKDVGI